MSRHQALVRVGLAGLMTCGLGALGCSFGCSFGAPAIGDAPPGDAAPDVPPDVPSVAERVTSGLVALWRFDEGAGDHANDSRMSLVSSPPLAPIPLPISDPRSVTWVSGGLRLDTPVRAGTQGAAHVSRDVLATGEVTLEAWVSPAMLSQGDGKLPGNLPNYALVLSVSPSYAYHNAMIAQVGDRWQGRILTAATSSNAIPAIDTPAGTIAGTKPAHVVLVASATERALYVNGVVYRAPLPSTGIGPLNLPPPAVGWFDYFPISVGRERDNPSQSRPWLGTIWLAAIYNRALTVSEIQQNLVAGHDCAGC